MAQTTKRSSSGRSSSNTRKRSSSAKGRSSKNKKKDEGPDILTLVIVLTALILLCVLVANMLKDKDRKKDPDVRPSEPVITGEPSKDEPSPSPVATKPVTPTAEPSQEPTPVLATGLSVSEARLKVQEKLDLSKYSVEVLDDKPMSIDEFEYYMFCVKDAQNQDMSPLILVEKESGKLFCYDPYEGGVTEFVKFPLDETQTGMQDKKQISEQEACEMLASVSKEKLGLAKETSAYRMEVDAWPTTIGQKDCYGINLLEQKGQTSHLRGVFYIATDGSGIYGRDPMSEDFFVIEEY